jgi:hypothetical protein
LGGGVGERAARCGWQPATRTGTLLGPERTTVVGPGGLAGVVEAAGCCFGGPHAPPHRGVGLVCQARLASHTGHSLVGGVGGGLWVVGWLLVEICIVDASIFCFLLLWLSC